MKDYLASIEKLRKDAAECALIRDLAADKTKRETYDALSRHFQPLADEIQRVLNTAGKLMSDAAAKEVIIGTAHALSYKVCRRS